MLLFLSCVSGVNLKKTWLYLTGYNLFIYFYDLSYYTVIWSIFYLKHNNYYSFKKKNENESFNPKRQKSNLCFNIYSDVMNMN